MSLFSAIDCHVRDYCSSEKRSYRHHLLINSVKEHYGSSLMFRIAYEIADKGENVYYICSKKRMNERLPLGVYLHSSDIDCYHPFVLSRINLKYVENLNQLSAVLLAINHTSLLVDDEPISSIFIDGLSELLLIEQSTSENMDNVFLHTSSEVQSVSAMIKSILIVTAMLSDLVKRFNQHQLPVNLFVSDSLVDLNVLNLYSRVIDVVIQVDCDMTITDGCKVYMSSMRSDSPVEFNSKTARLLFEMVFSETTNSLIVNK